MNKNKPEILLNGRYIVSCGCGHIHDITDRISQAEDNMRKAYGGCDNCFGKGYSTQHDHINCCTCDRGKQLDKLIKEVKDNMRKRCVEALPKFDEISLRLKWEQSKELQYQFLTSDDYVIFKYRSGLERATQNINNLDKE